MQVRQIRGRILKAADAVRGVIEPPPTVVREVDDATRKRLQNEVAAEIAAIPGLRKKEWKRASREQRSAAIQAAVNATTRVYRIPSQRVVIKDLPYSQVGSQQPFLRRITVASSCLGKRSAADAVEAALHETRHAIQYEACRKPTTPIEREWHDNWYDYIEASESYRRYYNQPLEVDARRFAEAVTNAAGLSGFLRRVGKKLEPVGALGVLSV